MRKYLGIFLLVLEKSLIFASKFIIIMTVEYVTSYFSFT